jgi:hypothetical protein
LCDASVYVKKVKVTVERGGWGLRKEGCWFRDQKKKNEGC